MKLIDTSKSKHSALKKDKNILMSKLETMKRENMIYKTRKNKNLN